MTGRLQAELKQSRPFPVHEEAVVGILKTADALDQRVSAVLKRFDLTSTQYNVLRILRGAGAAGRTCREIGERMIAHDPDVTRMLDRLEKRGLISRERDGGDRRVVRSMISQAGLHLLDKADPAVDQHNEEVTAGVSKQALAHLVRTLEVMRGARL